jgi:hypothetical protein
MGKHTPAEQSTNEPKFEGLNPGFAQVEKGKKSTIEENSKRFNF